MDGDEVGSGDVWVHDARLRPSLTLETELVFPSDGDDAHRSMRVVIEDPAPALVQDAVRRFWAHMNQSDDEDE